MRISYDAFRIMCKNLFCIICSLFRCERAHTGAAYSKVERAHILYNKNLNRKCKVLLRLISGYNILNVAFVLFILNYRASTQAGI